jgi:hypothetical protein
VEFDIDMHDAEAVVGLFDQAVEAMRASPLRKGSAVLLPARGRLIATGDLHDNPYHLQALLKLAKLDQSEDHHLILQEMIHGERLINSMDFSHRMLIKAAGLVVQYPQQVHPLLANHELSQMTGVGVSKGAGNSVLLFADALEFVFGDAAGEVAGAINRFIRTMPLALLSEDGVCCAHSLPAEHAMKHFDPAILDRALDDADFAKPHGSAYLMVWGRQYSEAHVDQLAERWGVKHFCLGHEFAETGIEPRGRRVVVLNSDHERAVAVPIDLANVPDIEEMLMSAVPLRSVRIAPGEAGS